MTICFYCGKEVERIPGNARIIPLDRPYVNLFVHRKDCLPFIQGYGENKYLAENMDKVYDYIDSQNKKTKNKKMEAV